jgi:formylglycine-generating enzyme required for sulfatase activity
MDMAGNLYEWVNDWFDETYYTTGGPPWNNPQGPGLGDDRIFRGGSWPQFAANMRTSLRTSTLDITPDTTNYIGFRCAHD